MKSIFLFVLALFIVQFSYAQWQLDASGNYYLPSGGTVSVGSTVSTGNKFMVQGWGNLVNFSNLSDQDINFLITPPGASDKCSLICSSTPTNLAFGVNGYEKMRITNAGNVGIGTITPDARLSIAMSNAAGISIRGNSSTYQGSDFYIGRSSSDQTVGYSPCIQFNDQATNAGALIQAYQGQFQFFTAPPGATWNESMRIAGNGYVGIGTTNPGSNLTIQDRVRVSTSNGYGGYYAYDASNGGSCIFSLSRQGNDLSLNAYDGMGFAVAARTGQTTNYNMFINASGNVGIGTVNPDQKLTVAGTIHSSEVTVDTKIPVPDYVFQPSYKLADLPSLEEYVKKYHHLPEIPSAGQIQKEGLNLGEMNTLLLKKVEELTLYLIEKDKELNELKNDLKELKKMVKEK